MSQSDLQPELLLFRDKHGQKAQFQDVVDDGLDGGYEDRIPDLIRLSSDGTPYQRLLAVAMLAAWCQPEGFETIQRWAAQPESVPWSDEPVAYDRIYGSDSGFETLADAIKTSYFCDADVAAVRLQAIRTLLESTYSRFYLDRMLALAILRDKQHLRDLEPALRSAIDASLARLRAGDRPGFDLAFQTASLLMPLARVDDSAAAKYARELMELNPTNEKMLRETANAMAEGAGPDTLAILHRLQDLAIPSVQADLRSALQRRSAARGS